ncbi:SDR family NAD(P)-dependent oxidoreductase [Paenirhodobacter populi]|uniref:Probable oxidoreductase n=1 Tax=Paenirhodobacter populi TaxID=2306993 RepID=A0A443J9I2_9RHOB|nr:SDR family NAD(P)-dependent oxidoreductase [Sinirhodobacter populi]RWR17176.1 SDR family NAD(P)-dependent oxidoreductase [Sinirhodobacter populi]
MPTTVSPSPQCPIQSGFTAASTTSDVIAGIDLAGKVAIVTGGYAGLGLETARTLAAAGASVIVPARDLAKARAVLNGIERVDIESMDLLDRHSIDTFADRFLASERPLHILVNSAGIMALPTLTLDARGYEHHFAVNHLGHFQLTRKLLPALRRANGARVVSVSAWAHRLSNVVFHDPFFQGREYQPMLGYAQSKTANILFAAGLDMREQRHGVRAFSLHPGSIVTTDLGRNFDQDQLRAFGVIDSEGRPILDPQKQLKTVEQGAATQVWCATSPQLDGIGGVYCENVEVARLVPPEESTNWGPADSTKKLGVMPYAVDPDGAERLWALSEALLDATPRQSA